MSERDTGQEARDAMANVRAGMGVIRTREHTAAVPNIQQDIGSAFRAKREEIEQLNQRIAALESELAATKREREGLREVVEKLPKTADGVVVVPGMNLYGYQQSVSGNWYKIHETDICLAGYTGDYYDPHPTECARLYSTEEAALAARDATEGGSNVTSKGKPFPSNVKASGPGSAYQIGGETEGGGA